MKYKKHLFIFTLVYFLLGVIHIHFALLALFCLMFPIILLVATKKKTWCQGYCPRASLFTVCTKGANCSSKIPRFFVTGNMKWIVLVYFLINLFVITATTIRVSAGGMMPMNSLRFLLFIQLPFDLPQLFHFYNAAPWMTHLSYRLYSMMMTTTFIGILFAFIYKPRTWCVICPISTVSGLYLNKTKRNPLHDNS
jgi:hypothetical protein